MAGLKACEFTGGEHAILLDNARDVHRNSQPGSRAEAGLGRRPHV